MSSPQNSNILKLNVLEFWSQCLKITKKNRICVFEFWRFPPILVLLEMTCLVTLFDCKLQVFKKSPKLTLFGIFNELLSTKNVNVARFARNVEATFSVIFKHCVLEPKIQLKENC